MTVMLVERYWEDTFASRITLVSDQCEVGYCIVTLFYCNTFSGKKLHKMGKMCNFSFQPEKCGFCVALVCDNRKWIIVTAIVTAIVTQLTFCFTVIYNDLLQCYNNIYIKHINAYIAIYVLQLYPNTYI